ncbi:hypothetical protein [Thalassotalea fusca]
MKINISLTFLIAIKAALALSFTHSANALEFNSFCDATQAERDCSAEFIQALEQVALSGEPLLFRKNEVFWLDWVSTDDLRLDGVTIIGEGNDQDRPKIVTNRLELVNISNLNINNIIINGKNNEEGENIQKHAVVLLGAKSLSKRVENISISNTLFNESAQDLLAIAYVDKVQLINNTFKRAGLGMHLEPLNSDTDPRPRGSGLLLNNVADANIIKNNFFEIKKVGIFLGASQVNSKNIIVANNLFDLQNFEKPTQRYGLKGGVGIYFDQDGNFSDVKLISNTVKNYHLNGFRINGKNFYVENNLFNSVEGCGTEQTSFEEPIGGPAVKSHYMDGAWIKNNCVHNSGALTVLESWNMIKNVTISDNKVYSPHSGIVAEYKFGGRYQDVKVLRNEIYHARAFAIVFRASEYSQGNVISGNTISSLLPYTGERVIAESPLLYFQKQEGLWFYNNWINAEAHSAGWTTARFDGLRYSNIVRNAIISPAIDSKDKSYGGIRLDGESRNNTIDRIEFTNLNPGIHDSGSNNQVSNITLFE